MVREARLEGLRARGVWWRARAGAALVVHARTFKRGAVEEEFFFDGLKRISPGTSIIKSASIGDVIKHSLGTEHRLEGMRLHVLGLVINRFASLTFN